jgi:phosphate transport system substrate-binding protein
MNTRIKSILYKGVCLLFLFSIAACAPKPAVQATQPAVQPTEQLKGDISVSGAFALYPMMQRWAEEYKKVNPGVNFDVSAGGAGKGMADALGGAVDIGMVSRAVTSEEEAKGAFWVAVVKDAVFPTVNTQNPVLNDLLAKGVTKETFIGIFITGEIKTWGQVVGRPEVTDEIHVYTRSDACGAADAWAKYLGNKKQEDLKGIGVFGDPGLLDAVVQDSLGIGYNNLNYAYDAASGKPVAGTISVPIDANGNGKADPDEIMDTKAKAMEMIANGKYPSPPARDLNLVTKGKPSGLVADFMVWVLTDGQKYIAEVGYIQLPEATLSAGLDKLR